MRMKTEFEPEYLTDLTLRRAIVHDSHHHQELRESNLTVSVYIVQFKGKVLQISLETHRLY